MLLTVITEKSQHTILWEDVTARACAEVLDLHLIFLDGDDDLVRVAAGVALLRDDADDLTEGVLIILQINTLLIHNDHWIDRRVGPEHTFVRTAATSRYIAIAVLKFVDDLDKIRVIVGASDEGTI